MFEAKGKSKTSIGTSSSLRGNLFSQEDIIIEGEVKGKISTSANLEIRKTAKVKANLEGEFVIIAGQVEGNIKAKEKLEIAKTAKIYGDINSKIFSMAAGAILNGKCKTGEGEKTEIKKVIKEESPENLTTLSQKF